MPVTAMSVGYLEAFDGVTIDPLVLIVMLCGFVNTSDGRPSAVCAGDDCKKKRNAKMMWSDAIREGVDLVAFIEVTSQAYLVCVL
jgi:hypothetical protein